jgi:hypothetical protein
MMYSKIFLVVSVIFSLVGCQNDFFQQNKFEVISGTHTVLLNKSSGEAWLLEDKNWVLITKNNPTLPAKEVGMNPSFRSKLQEIVNNHNKVLAFLKTSTEGQEILARARNNEISRLDALAELNKILPSDIPPISPVNVNDKDFFGVSPN